MYDIAKDEFSSVEEAIEYSAYRERISFLLQNPRLGYESLCILGEDYRQCSNCFGTALFLVRGESVFLKSKSLQPSLEGGAAILGEPGKGDFCAFPHTTRPGYVGPKFMEWFFENKCVRISEREKDCIVATTGDIFDGDECPAGYGLLHACLYLGRVDGKPWIFHQEREGSSYRYTALRTFSNVRKTAYYRFQG